jgi:tripartite-type tricarboxylate transporter receptor subunit TctC
MTKATFGFAFAAILAALGTATAQEWPSRPLTMVVPFAAGGTGDVYGRILAARLAEVLGHPVILENVAGAGGMVGASRVAKAAPDGYQFVYGNIGTHAQNQTLYKNPLYNSATDFAPVALIAESPLILVTRADLPVTSLAEFIAYARQNQAKMQYGSPGAGTPNHLACALLNAAIGTDITHVPYRGGGPVMQDLIAGRIDFWCSGTANAIPQIESKTIKAIAILSEQRSPNLPALASAREQGLTHFEAGAWTAFFLPKATHPAIIRKLNEAAVAIMETQTVRDRLNELGATVVEPGRRSPEYLQQFVENEVVKWAAVIKAAGVSAE